MVSTSSRGALRRCSLGAEWRCLLHPPTHSATLPPFLPLLQVPVIQVMLGQLGLVTSEMMFSQWR